MKHPKHKHAAPRGPSLITALVANAAGEIFDLPGFAAVGSDGPLLAPLNVPETREMPFGGELMYLPDRIPLLYDIRRKHIAAFAENPYVPGQAIFPVSAFNSPGYAIAFTSAYEERSEADFLPLFSYGAVGWHRGKFRSAVIQVDDEPRQDLRQMPFEKIKAGIQRLRKQLPDNRLRAHLENCAVTYGCPAGKNFFLGRYEAPLPTSSTCNARCLGCISFQPEGCMASSQNRINFSPTPQEVAEIALAHIRRVDHAVVSFGQGCEGDPLMAAETIREAIGRIRAETDRGTINMNTNGSLPHVLAPLFDAGLDSVRISLNSVREPCYTAYFRPRGYSLADVIASIDTALARGKHVAINYLHCPGLTDLPEERDALLTFLYSHPIQMIQWRNLNFDPQRYLKRMGQTAASSTPIGMQRLLDEIRQAFPLLRYGYFNPPKEKF